MMHKENIIIRNEKIESDKALIMLHGRGGNAGDILSLADHLQVKDYLLLAPQATNNTWYPYAFLEKPEANEPWLCSALDLVKKAVQKAIERGIPKERIYFLGFSQGACLTLEYAARNAARYGDVAAFTGGLIGDKIYAENYKGNFAGTPVFIGSSNPDFHVPVERVHESTRILKNMGADVTERIYDNMGHIITQEEIDEVNRLIFKTETHKIS